MNPGKYWIFFSLEAGMLFIYSAHDEEKDHREKEIAALTKGNPHFKTLEVRASQPGAVEIIEFLEMERLERDAQKWGLKLKVAFTLAFTAGCQAQRAQNPRNIARRDINQLIGENMELEKSRGRKNPFLDGKPNKTLTWLIEHSWLMGFDWATEEPGLDADTVSF